MGDLKQQSVSYFVEVKEAIKRRALLNFQRKTEEIPSIFTFEEDGRTIKILDKDVLFKTLDNYREEILTGIMNDLPFREDALLPIVEYLRREMDARTLTLSRDNEGNKSRLEQSIHEKLNSSFVAWKEEMKQAFEKIDAEALLWKVDETLELQQKLKMALFEEVEKSKVKVDPESSIYQFIFDNLETRVGTEFRDILDKTAEKFQKALNSHQHSLDKLMKILLQKIENVFGHSSEVNQRRMVELQEKIQEAVNPILIAYMEELKKNTAQQVKIISGPKREGSDDSVDCGKASSKDEVSEDVKSPGNSEELPVRRGAVFSTSPIVSRAVRFSVADEDGRDTTTTDSSRGSRSRLHIPEIYGRGDVEGLRRRMQNY